MYCKHCGKKLEESSIFCPSCGTNLQALAQNQPIQPTPQKTSFSEKILRAINIFVIALSALVGVVALLCQDFLEGILVLSITFVLVFFVFRKTQIEKIKVKVQNSILQKLSLLIIYILIPNILLASIGIGASLEKSYTKRQLASRYDKLASYIQDNGKIDEKNTKISKPLYELGTIYSEEDGNISIRVDKDKNIYFEFYKESNNSTDYISIKLIRGEDKAEVTTIYTYTTNTQTLQGYIVPSLFSNHNATIYNFKANSAPFGTDNAKALLLSTTDLLLTYSSWLLKNCEAPITLYDLGFANY